MTASIALLAVVLLALLALAITLLPDHRLPHRLKVSLVVLIAVVMIAGCGFWLRILATDAGADVDLAFVAVWVVALIPLIQRSPAGPRGAGLVVDLLMAAAFVGLALEVAAVVVCPQAIMAPGAEKVTLTGSAPWLTLALLSLTFTAGAVLLMGITRRFAWEYGPLFAALLLLFTPAHPLLQALNMTWGYGIVPVTVWLAALVLLYQAQRATTAMALVGVGLALVIPLPLALLAS